MAVLADLPPELIRNIVSHFVHSHEMDLANQRKPHGCNYVGTGDVRSNIKFNLGSRDHYGSTFQVAHLAENRMGNITWPEALPSNPLLSLCLVNRAFRQFAQEALFKHVVLLNLWQVYRLHRTLSSTNQHACWVHSLQFKWFGYYSMGRGGYSIICEIIRSCPWLQSITIVTSLLIHCEEPLLEALASQMHIKEFVILDNIASPDSELTVYQWRLEKGLNQLFSKWNLAETIKLIGWSHHPLKVIDRSVPLLNRALRTIVLHDLNVDEWHLSSILKGCQDSMRTLQITRSTRQLTRSALCQLLKEFTSPDLECLILEVGSWFHYDHGIADDAELNPGLLDNVFKSSLALRKIQELSITGPLVSREVLSLLPQSLVKLTFDRCYLSAAAFVEALGVGGGVEGLTALKCCTIGEKSFTRDFRSAPGDLPMVLKELEVRKVCVHLDGAPGNSLMRRLPPWKSKYGWSSVPEWP
ncbi:hypothetical protein Pst134EA_009049 [Puccinia striiformis f. sp. tritici]|uniref:hypothetical protein n=1 Tax=Puccinia striiformis f. sp. tritici TaxID=168172 RepID=UPI0020072ECE|nr:hypothetical protein Pst134EA_009049 [Puccinia striiformis f. sp. tritici]KAH9468508.1 hypothetical protein Pst134EA_009049 [Puccinia striiformis f. sp. tritici]KAI9622130.1 hypothetical protein KEM48_007443 [Puccinia striiformis f. sp. tritici PST-130]